MEKQEKRAKNKPTHTTIKQVFDKLHPGNSNMDRLIVGSKINRIWYKWNPDTAPLKVEQQEGDEVFRVCAYPVSFTNTIKKVITSFVAFRENRQREQQEAQRQEQEAEETVVAAPGEPLPAVAVLAEEPRKRKRVVRTVAVKQVEAVTSSDTCFKGKKRVS